MAVALRLMACHARTAAALSQCRETPSEAEEASSERLRRATRRRAREWSRLAAAVLDGRRCLVQRPKGAEGRLELYKLPAAEARAAVHLALAMLERPK